MQGINSRILNAIYIETQQTMQNYPATKWNNNVLSVFPLFPVQYRTN